MNGKCVLITGGAGLLGRALGEKFISEGWSVFLADTEFPAEKVENAAYLKFNPNLAREDADAVIREIEMAGYALDSVVCAHRDAGDAVRAEELSLDLWEDMLRKNVFSCYMLSRCAANAMIAKKKRGSIVFVGDICYKVAVPGRCAYSSSMGALASMTKGLALDFAPYGIRVNCVLPGPIESENPAIHNESVPTGSLTTPLQAAQTAYFLAAGEAENVTGASLVVDGGMDCLVPGAY